MSSNSSVSLSGGRVPARLRRWKSGSNTTTATCTTGSPGRASVSSPARSSLPRFVPSESLTRPNLPRARSRVRQERARSVERRSLSDRTAVSACRGKQQRRWPLSDRSVARPRSLLRQRRRLATHQPLYLHHARRGGHRLEGFAPLYKATYLVPPPRRQSHRSTNRH